MAKQSGVVLSAITPGQPRGSRAALPTAHSIAALLCAERALLNPSIISISPVCSCGGPDTTGTWTCWTGLRSRRCSSTFCPASAASHLPIGACPQHWVSKDQRGSLHSRPHLCPLPVVLLLPRAWTTAGNSVTGPFPAGSFPGLLLKGSQRTLSLQDMLDQALSLAGSLL